MENTAFSDFESSNLWNFRLKYFRDGSVQGLYSYNHVFVSGSKISDPDTPKVSLPKLVSSISDPVRSATNSLKRALQKIYELAKSNTFDYFVTFTFNDNFLSGLTTDYLSNYSIYASAMADFTHWLSVRSSRSMSAKNSTSTRVGSSGWENPERLARKLEQQPIISKKEMSEHTCPNSARWIIVPERHPKNPHRWHFHGLISADFLDLRPAHSPYTGKLKRDSHGRQIYNLHSFSWGFTEVTAVDNPARASNYLLKYLSKQLSKVSSERLVPKGKKTYWSSRNLQLAKRVHLNLTSREVAEYFAVKSSYTKTLYTPVSKMSFFEFRVEHAPRFADYCKFLFPQFNKIFILLTSLFGCDRIGLG